MNLISTALKGCYVLQPPVSYDERGSFVKTFHAERFAELGMPTNWLEEYYSNSRKGVIRGMHFHTPPYDHEKLVYCIQGRVLDVVLDLRRTCSTYGQCISVELDSARVTGLVIPKGLAHGFLALTDDVLIIYKVTSTYTQTHDAGVRWDSFGFDWGISEPIVSSRDRAHPSLTDFVSPF